MGHWVTAKEALRNIATLKPNWNYNGAPAFSRELIDKCEDILEKLPVDPFVCPTAAGSIQFEYNNKNDDYLEFEIYEDRVEMFKFTKEKEEEVEELITGYDTKERMIEIVLDFYKKG